MNKEQKSLLMNVELLALIERIQRTTGVSFTRVITAATIQYLLSEKNGPDTCWMEFAVLLDLGETSIDGILKSLGNI